MNMSRFLLPLVALVALPLALSSCGRRDAFNIRDVDPGQAGEVRSLGPESQDVIRLADLMTRSLLAQDVIRDAPHPPTIAMLPMENNTRFAFNQEVFTTRLRAELNRRAEGRLRFVARHVLDDVQTERDMRRSGEVDYDPERRTRAIAGADFFLVGRVDGLSMRSRAGDSEYSVYSFELVDTETTITVWQDLYEVRREGRDDVIYR